MSGANEGGSGLISDQEWADLLQGLGVGRLALSPSWEPWKSPCCWGNCEAVLWPCLILGVQGGSPSLVPPPMPHGPGCPGSAGGASPHPSAVCTGPVESQLPWEGLSKVISSSPSLKGLQLTCSTGGVGRTRYCQSFLVATFRGENCYCATAEVETEGVTDPGSQLVTAGLRLAPGLFLSSSSAQASVPHLQEHRSSELLPLPACPQASPDCGGGDFKGTAQ